MITITLPTATAFMFVTVVVFWLTLTIDSVRDGRSWFPFTIVVPLLAIWLAIGLDTVKPSVGSMIVGGIHFMLLLAVTVVVLAEWLLDNNSELAICAELRTSLPDDTEWDDAGAPLVPGGRNIARILLQILQEAGIEASHPAPQSYYGWQIDVLRKSVGITLIIHSVKPVVLSSKFIGWNWLRKQKRALKEDVLAALKTGLERDERIVDVNWMTWKEFQERTLG